MKLKEPYTYSEWLNIDLKALVEKIELYRLATDIRLGSNKIRIGNYTIEVYWSPDPDSNYPDA